MRQRYLALLSMFATLPAMAITFQTRLESVEWKVEGDQFECRLVQPITDFGAGEFVQRAGEGAVFSLKSTSLLLGHGSATLLAAAAPWQPGRGDINLGSVRMGGGGTLFSTSQGQASRLIGGLIEGRSTVIRTISGETGRPTEVRVLPVRFNQGYSDFQACTTKLLPMNFDQVSRTQVGFPGGGADLDAADKRRLDTILAYMKADPSVNHVELDGHSDNSGNRLTNRDMSRRRALAVLDYLKAAGVPETDMVMRFHGEQYPVAPNTNAANRALNRRVNIQLSRVAASDKPAVPAEAAQKAAVPASQQAPAQPGPAQPKPPAQL
ncbi:OmpA/MotB domain-containing protein [Pseudomonas sp. M47T1]|uniref:flagellar protein MotY n=1 Tax=Pseudomonas sp. M47T1 TaxID=1179778 RepID=UPI00026071EF|nr:OmpA family protein [Pseudomonas sp. M47T1]EIK98341.1 OmpA/MotB domain-containing protein [Pseudomonas sp. M47T1]